MAHPQKVGEHVVPPQNTRVRRDKTGTGRLDGSGVIFEDGGDPDAGVFALVPLFWRFEQRSLSEPLGFLSLRMDQGRWTISYSS
jgi:hypothetical protein